MQFKKILAFLLAAVLILSVFTVSVGAESVEIFEVGVTAEPTTPVSTTPVIYKPGDNVTVTISADQNTGFDFLWLKVSFDADALEYVDYTTNTLFGKETFSVKSGYLTFTAILNRVSTATGDMFKINFKIKDDFCGDAEIVASLVRDDEANCKNGDANVPFVGDKASVTAHAYDNACDPDHVYDNACDAECNVCKQIRTVPDHVYDNACDITCNVCEQIRLVGDHVYDNACDIDCNICSQIRNVPDHIYDNNCDTDCNVCSAVRDITHNYEWIVDKLENCGVNGFKHEECTICHVKRNENTVIPATGNHIYDNECDKVCNVCGNLRLTDEHKYDWVTDKQADCGNNGMKHEECTICHVKRNENTVIPATGNHVYDNACDADCNVCSAVRDITHNFEWIVDKSENCGIDGSKHEECTVCHVKRNENTVIPATGNHVYDNACDAECNVCNQTRTVPDHIYDNNCDTDCNVCGDIRDITHNYEWIVDKSENCGIDGSKHEECTVCHVKRNENTVIPATGNHTYDNDCDKTCNVCENIRLTDDHKYDWIIDKEADCGNDGIKHGECSICGAKQFENTVIPATGNHTYDNVCDAECNVCKQIRTVGEHEYDNACDTNCNVCNAVRSITHNYKWIVDKSENCGMDGSKYEECTVCHTKRNENTVIAATGNHTYDNACDTDCNVCQQVREISHNYEWVVDKDENCGVNGAKHEECTVCHTKRNENTVINATGNHTYDNACDAECNACKQTRTVSDHVYSHIADKYCDICNAEREVKGAYLIEEGGNSYYYLDGVKQTEFTDLVKIDGTWYYIEKGVWATSVDTLHKLNGKWFLIKKGIWKATTGIVEYKGKDFYVSGGKWFSTVKGLKKVGSTYYLIKSGKWSKTTEIYKDGSTYFYVKSGKWTKTTTLYKKSGKYYAIKDGKWYKSKIIIKYSGKKYYCDKGYAQTSKTGTVTVSGKKYTVKKGIVK